VCVAFAYQMYDNSYLLIIEFGICSLAAILLSI